MKKVVSILLTVLLVFTLCSCAKNDVNNAEKIVGTWNTMDAPYDDLKTLTFFDDGTFVFFGAEGPGKYQISDEHITLFYDDSVTWQYEFDNENHLILYVEDNNSIEKVVFSKV